MPGPVHDVNAGFFGGYEMKKDISILYSGGYLGRHDVEQGINGLHPGDPRFLRKFAW
jgi:hypothetical protein